MAPKKAKKEHKKTSGRKSKKTRKARFIGI